MTNGKATERCTGPTAAAIKASGSGASSTATAKWSSLTAPRRKVISRTTSTKCLSKSVTSKNHPKAGSSTLKTVFLKPRRIIEKHNNTHIDTSKTKSTLNDNQAYNRHESHPITDANLNCPTLLTYGTKRSKLDNSRLLNKLLSQVNLNRKAAQYSEASAACL